MTDHLVEEINKAAWQRNNPAHVLVDRLLRLVAEFEQKLNTDEEVGALLIAAPNERAVHIRSISAISHDPIMFDGVDSNNRPIKLAQYYSQVSIALISLPKIDDPSHRIGFDLASASTPSDTD